MSDSPKRPAAVLATLILVAAVANLNLAVANVALPSIGAAFDAGQTSLNLVAVGFSLGLAASVLYLGALGDRYGRKAMLIGGMAVSIPASLLAAFEWGSVFLLTLPLAPPSSRSTPTRSSPLRRPRSSGRPVGFSGRDRRDPDRRGARALAVSLQAGGDRAARRLPGRGRPCLKAAANLPRHSFDQPGQEAGRPA